MFDSLFHIFVFLYNEISRSLASTDKLVMNESYCLLALCAVDPLIFCDVLGTICWLMPTSIDLKSHKYSCQKIIEIKNMDLIKYGFKRNLTFDVSATFNGSTRVSDWIELPAVNPLSTCEPRPTFKPSAVGDTCSPRFCCQKS